MKINLILIGHSGSWLDGVHRKNYINCDTVPRVGEIISLIHDKEFAQSYPNEPVCFMVREVNWCKIGEELIPELECSAYGAETDEGVREERQNLLIDKGWLLDCEED